MTQQVSPSLPLDVWATLHAALNDDPLPFRTRRHVVGLFEAAMKDAQEPHPQGGTASVIAGHPGEEG